MDFNLKFFKIKQLFNKTLFVTFHYLFKSRFPFNVDCLIILNNDSCINRLKNNKNI